MTKRMAYFQNYPTEPPLLSVPGWSNLAIPSAKAWDGKDRPKGWKGSVYGLVVHTTGRGLPGKAEKAGQYPTVRAVNYYSKSHGCHYVCGYRGYTGGDLIQMASEDMQANGVGTVDQRKSIVAGRWKKDLPKHLVNKWKKRWPGYANPLDLLPGTRSCNPAYIHLECIPLTTYFMDRSGGDHDPSFKGSLFTDEQYETIAMLACDIAARNDWPGEWWRTPRLLGHEDLSPLTRHNKKGAWDPGFLRAPKWFDWGSVMEWITSTCEGDFDKIPRPTIRPRGHYAKY